MAGLQSTQEPKTRISLLRGRGACSRRPIRQNRFLWHHQDHRGHGWPGEGGQPRSGRNEGGDDCVSALSVSLGPRHLQLAVHTLSQGFLAGGTEQPKTGVGGIWLSHRWVMAGEEQGDIRTGQQERAAAAQ